ncbi:hypothetical protein HWV62_18282 [Athelia sp. TMB]|nr:hypothetical protein HWV62_18282 [Athelia sp. TMB]
MPRDNSPEIIDLTASTSDTPSDADEDVIEIENPQTTGSAKKDGKRRKRKRSKKGSLETGQVETVNPESSAAGGARASKGNGVQSGPSRNRSHSPGSRRLSGARRRSRSPNAQDDFSSLFYVDVLPQPLPSSTAIAVEDTSAPAEPKLLLPNHVSIIESESIEIIRPPTLDQDENDFIEYLDYNDEIQGGAVRYFDELKEKPATFVCKNCRAQGQHKTRDCPIEIVTSDVESKVIYHTNVPTNAVVFWMAVTDVVPQNTKLIRAPSLTLRRNALLGGASMNMSLMKRVRRYCKTESHKKHRSLPMADEDSWAPIRPATNAEALVIGAMYELLPPSYLFHLTEPSAFSAHNVMSGPFFDPAKEQSTYKAGYRDDLPDNWGKGAPSNVGRQGRRKDQAKMEQRMRELDGESDGDNWFSNLNKGRNTGAQPAFVSRTGKPPPSGPKKLSFGISIKNASQQFQPPSSNRPSLLDRMDDGQNGRRDDRQGSSKDVHTKNDSSQKRKRDDDSSNGRGRYNGDTGGRSRDRAGDRDGNKRREWDRGKGGNKHSEDPYRRHAPGPRYTGGYSR